MAGGTLLKNTGFAALAAALALASTAGVASAQEVREVPGDLAVGRAAAAPVVLAQADGGWRGRGGGGGGWRGGGGGQNGGGGWNGGARSEAPAPQAAPQAAPAPQQRSWSGGEGPGGGRG